jgi:aldose sugar dehydrogenase
MRMLATLLLSALLIATSAPAFAQSAAYRVETIAENLEHPWSLAFLPDGSMLVTERAGRLRVIEADGTLRQNPVAGVPETWSEMQSGLFEVLLDPGFESNRTLYLSFTHGPREANNTRVVRAQFDGQRLSDVQPIFTATPMDSNVHYGARMVFLPDGTLVIGLGDGFYYREQAQDLGNHLGTIVRINTDGSIPADNPFVGQPGAMPEIYSYGNRNVQGLFVHEGRLYAHEHGPRGGDEINLIQPGRNYGWPVITYGIDYGFGTLTPFTEMPGMEQPLVMWKPSIAPGGMVRYDADLFPQWRGNVFVAALAEESVRRVVMHDDGSFGEQEALFLELGWRMRYVRVGPEGALYLLTDHEDGRVLRVVPNR